LDTIKFTAERGSDDPVLILLAIIDEMAVPNGVPATTADPKSELLASV
jgi:hypothetical protein